jgi:hypothetical protein
MGDADERIVEALPNELLEDRGWVQTKRIAFRVAIRDLFGVIERPVRRRIRNMIHQTEICAVPTEGMRLSKRTRNILRRVVSTLGDDRMEIGVESRNIGEVMQQDAFIISVIAVADEGNGYVRVGMSILEVFHDVQDFMTGSPDPRLHGSRAVHDEANLDSENVHVIR